MRSTPDELEEESIVAAFPDHERAIAAVHALDRARIPPDHVGVTAGNVRQAREAAGSFSVAGAIVGAIVGAVIALAFVFAGGDQMRQNVVAILLGAPVLIIAFGAIGALTGRARLFQKREYGAYEGAVEAGEALVSVSGKPAELRLAREVLEREGAVAIRREETGEAL
jgi:hypothetical protein